MKVTDKGHSPTIFRRLNKKYAKYEEEIRFQITELLAHVLKPSMQNQKEKVKRKDIIFQLCFSKACVLST